MLMLSIMRLYDNSCARCVLVLSAPAPYPLRTRSDCSPVV